VDMGTNHGHINKNRACFSFLLLSQLHLIHKARDVHLEFLNARLLGQELKIGFRTGTARMVMLSEVLLCFHELLEERLHGVVASSHGLVLADHPLGRRSCDLVLALCDHDGGISTGGVPAVGARGARYAPRVVPTSRSTRPGCRAI
jgi:hypothetical protein